MEVDPVVGVVVPAGQSVQLLAAPELLLYVPMGQ